MVGLGKKQGPREGEWGREGEERREEGKLERNSEISRARSATKQDFKSKRCPTDSDARLEHTGSINSSKKLQKFGQPGIAACPLKGGEGNMSESCNTKTYSEGRPRPDLSLSSPLKAAPPSRTQSYNNQILVNVHPGVQTQQIIVYWLSWFRRIFELFQLWHNKRYPQFSMTVPFPSVGAVPNADISHSAAAVPSSSSSDPTKMSVRVRPAIRPHPNFHILQTVQRSKWGLYLRTILICYSSRVYHCGMPSGKTRGLFDKTGLRWRPN